MICNKCNGNKFVMGVGYMKKKCSACDGLGAIFTHDGLKKREPVIIDGDAPKKRGRPKKIIV